MAETYDIETDAGKVRLLISDVGGSDGKSFLFNDAEIAGFLALRGGDIRLAAATALRTIAGNEAQVSKKIKFLELTTDGPAVAKELINAAEKLEAEVDDDGEIEIAAMTEDELCSTYDLDAPEWEA
jgi:hypothetical protein